MRRVDRSRAPVPAAMAGDDSAAARERARAAAHVAEARAEFARTGKRGKAYGFKVYKDEAARLALETLFHGKCAYCESDYGSQAPMDVEHYRPKAGVEDDPDHWGYWWLAAEWENLLPSCIDCNRRRYQLLPQTGTASLADLRQRGEARAAGKETAFPVVAGTRATGLGPDPAAEIARERPLLLDPCRDNPSRHLTFLVDGPEPFGLALPRALPPDDPDALPQTGGTTPDTVHLSARGAASIQVYGLNRLGLVQARTRVLRHLETLRALIEDADRLAARLAASRTRIAREALPVIESLIDRLTGEIRRMSEPDQPYSALVTQWIDRWLDKPET